MGAPFFMFATGQSNIYAQPPYDWLPNARTKIWNNAIDSDESYGTGYNHLSTSVVDVASRYAVRIAEQDINKDVHLARFARNGRDISYWMGGALYVYPGNGRGEMALNGIPESTTQMYVSAYDSHGVHRHSSINDLRIGEYLWIHSANSIYKYRITGVPILSQEGVTIDVAYVSGSGGIPQNSGVQIEFQPRFLRTIQSAVPLALAAAGATKVDLLMWWQGESDIKNPRYSDEFEFVISYFQGLPWWGPQTKILICGINSTANNGIPECTPFNNRLASLAAASSNRYFMNTAASLQSGAWADVFHMTPTGYAAAGDLAMSVYTPPPVGNVIPDPPGSGVITSITAGPAATIMDVTTNPARQFLEGSTPYGLWIDGPPRPYRDGLGNTYLPLPHSENYRFKVPNWSNPAGWELQGPTMLSARTQPEGFYNNRQWLYGFWSHGSTVHALSHHEWYRNPTSKGGVPGFNALNYIGGNNNFNREWVNGLGFATSTNGGANFSMVPNNNSTRMVLIPEPWDVQQLRQAYGFYHPSNIVQEGNYYYACVEQRSAMTQANENCIAGVSLIRTVNIASSTGWEFWNGTSWEVVNHTTYQGNRSLQRPYKFFEEVLNFYTQSYNSNLGQNLRYHTPTGQWLMIGFAGNTPQRIGYSTSKTLANPKFETIIGINSPDPGIYYPYVSAFDPSATDLNFQNTGNTMTMLVVDHTETTIKRAQLTITVSAAGSAETYAVAPSVTGVNEGQTVTFNVTTTNVANGTIVYWTNAGSTNGADFTDGANTGSLTISNNFGSFDRTPSADSITEGNETLSIQLRTGSASGPVVANSQTVTIYDTSVPSTPTYQVYPSATTVNEGATVSFNVTTTNVANGNLYWTNAGSTVAADFTDGLNSGSFSINASAGSFTRTLTNDAVTEGTETIMVQIRTGSVSGPVVASASSVTVVDSSTPNQPAYSMSVSASSVTEGQSLTAFINTTNVPNGTLLFWNNGGSTVAADFTDGANSGGVTINSNGAQIVRTLVNDLTTEGTETISIHLRTGSIAGPVVASTQTVTVTDSSVTQLPSSKLRYRNQGGSAWLDAALVAGLRFRSEVNSWVNKTTTLLGVAVRNAANNGWITFAGALPEPTYAIAPSATSINEGQSVTYTVTTTNFGTGTLYWVNVGTTIGSDFTDSANSGTMTVTNNVGTFTRTLTNDAAAEGAETIMMQLRSTSISGAIVATAAAVTVNDTSIPAPVYSASASASAINEGQSVTFTVSTANVGSATLYWTNGGTSMPSDFTDGANSGTVSVVGNSGSVVRTLVNDALSEGNETIVFQLRTGSTSGPIVATAPAVLVYDTSVPAIPTYSMSGPSSINEGQLYAANIYTTDVPNGTVLYWTNAGSTVGSDFNDGANSGQIQISNNSAILYRTLRNDETTEGNETIQIQLRTGATWGPVVATAPVCTVIDTSIPLMPTMLTMNRNDLDFIFYPTPVYPNNHVEVRLVVTTTNFFNYATHPVDHFVVGIDATGQSGQNNPHCGPIIRNGRSLFSHARGFLFTADGMVAVEQWNGTSSPVVVTIPNTSGASFQPRTGTYGIRFRAGYTGSSVYQNLMTITIMEGSINGPVLFQGTHHGFGFANTGSSEAAFAIIAGGFVAPSPANGCVEPSGPGVAYGGYLPFSEFQFIGF